MRERKKKSKKGELCIESLWRNVNMISEWLTSLSGTGAWSVWWLLNVRFTHTHMLKYKDEYLHQTHMPAQTRCKQEWTHAPTLTKSWVRVSIHSFFFYQTNKQKYWVNMSWLCFCFKHKIPSSLTLKFGSCSRITCESVVNGSPRLPLQFWVPGWKRQFISNIMSAIKWRSLEPMI